MNERRLLLFIAALCQPVFPRAQASDVALKAAEIRIRDPFILADPARQTYFMCAQSANREGHRFIGVEAYASKDLVNWLPAKPVLELPADAGISMVWAPEVHAHEGRFYLFMIWSTFIPGSGYCVVSTESASGRVEGPWINQRHIYREKGGHGMLFRSFGGRLLMALHQPNTRGQERLHLFEVRDDGDTLEVTTEITGPPPPAIERKSSRGQS